MPGVFICYQRADVESFRLCFPNSPTAPSPWRHISGAAQRAGDGARVSRQLWWLTLGRAQAVLTALGATVSAPSGPSMVYMWAYSVLGVNGIALGLLG
jgi:hypothetical protein